MPGGSSAPFLFVTQRACCPWEITVGVTRMADVYCRWERRRYQDSEFEQTDNGVLVHVGSSPLHTVNGRLVDPGELEAADADPEDG